MKIIFFEHAHEKRSPDSKPNEKKIDHEEYVDG